MSETMIADNPILRRALDHEYKPYSTELGIDKVVAFGANSHKCPVYVKRTPPCTGGCPAGEDIRGYHNLLRGVEKSDNAWEAAWRRLTEKNPFPAVMGRVCPAPCQDKCNRSEHDETVGINAVEQAIGNYGIENNLAFIKPETKTGRKVAVVGAGPAGLSCAYQLALKGHDVTVFEASDKPGGMMRYGIMGYRVDRKVLDAEIQRIFDLGIELKTGVKIGVDVSLEELKKDYEAVYLGIGAQKGRNLPLKGSEGLANVTNAIDFLKEFELKSGDMKVGKRVVVVGDGDVAMDVARLALRLGAEEVSLLSGVSRDDMACSAFEYEEAEQEGTKMVFQVGTLAVSESNGALSLQCTKTVRKEKGEDGWKSPIPFFRYKPEEGSAFTMEVDLIVGAIGQGTDLTGLEGADNGKGWVSVSPSMEIKGMEGVFSGGDALSLTLLTTAIGHARKAADSMDEYMNGKKFAAIERGDIVRYKDMHPYYYKKSEQIKRSHKKIDNVVGNFEEILIPLAPEATVLESDRCMSCGFCFECNQCKMFCPQEAIEKFKNNPPGTVMFTEYERCIGCHICHEACPCGFIDMGMGHGL